MAMVSGNDPGKVSGHNHANDPQYERGPADRGARHERKTGDNEAVRQGDEDGFGETLSWRIRDCRTTKRALRPDRDGDEEQPDERAARAGAGQKELFELLLFHPSSPCMAERRRV